MPSFPISPNIPPSILFPPPKPQLGSIWQLQVHQNFTNSSFQAKSDSYFNAIGSGKIVFYGESAEEAEDFIFAIKERAYAEGKQKDNAWIADFASICFAKKALRWYEELNEETQSD